MEFLQFMLLGLGVGGAYAIEGLGVVLIFRASRVVNFAHTGLLAVGAYTFYAVSQLGYNKAVAVVAGLAASAAAGALMYILVLRPLRGATELMRLVGVLGAFLIIDNAILLIAGDTAHAAPAVLPGTRWRLGNSVSISADRMYLLAIAAVLTLVLLAMSRWTRLGLYTRAVAENEVTFRGLGHSADRVSLINWMLGGGLAGLAGILLASIVGLSPTQLNTLLLPALAAALVGRFSSFTVTFVTALLIGVASSEVTYYLPHSGLSDSVALLIIVIALLVRGRGLPSREEVATRLPAVGTGRVRPVVVVPLVLAGCWVASIVPSAWANAIVVTSATSLVFLSVVVLTGYAGQLSLAQFALAGGAALLAGKYSGGLGLPIAAVFILAVISVVPVGLLLGVPAFRTRGMSLAIATLGLGYVLSDAVLANPWATGGAVGVTTRSPELFGFSINPIVHPNRYAVFALLVFVVGALVTALARASFIGRRWLAVRVNERAAAASGVGVIASKALALCFSAALAGAGGVLFAFEGPTVVLTGYGTDASINAVVLTVIGGIGYLAGAVNGALIASGGLATFAIAQYIGLQYAVIGLVAGAVVVLNVITAPSGVADDVIRRWGKLRSGRRSTIVRRVEPVLTGRRVKSVHVALAVNDVSISFGGIRAVHRVSLRVADGEVVGLIGPNGAGKTTLIDCISGLSPSYEGSIELGGHAIDALSTAARARAGLCRSFQAVEMFDDLTLFDNFRVAAESGGSRASGARVRSGRGVLRVAPTCAEAVEQFGLTPDLDRLPTELSYGRRRLAGVARALASNPRILLLDEPAAGLDAPDRELLKAFIAHLSKERGIGVLFVEHDVSLVLSVSDRVVALDHGEVIAADTPDAVRQHPRVVQSYLGEETTQTVPLADMGGAR